MKPLAAAAVSAALLTGVGAWSLRSSDAAVAVAAVAGVAVLTAWLTRFHDSPTSDEATSGLALAGPAHLVSLVLVGRASIATALPVLAAQVVGAVAAGAAVLAVDAGGGTLIWDEPGRLEAGVLGAVVGLVVAWSALAADGGTVGWNAAGPIGAGALLGVGAAVAFHPAALIGVAVAGLLTWPVALIAAAGVLVGSAVGTFVVSWVSPH